MMIEAIPSHRWLAPQEDRAVLIEPPLASVADVVARNVAIGRQRQYDFQGRSLNELSALARRGLLDAARTWTASYREAAATAVDPAGPIFLAGHQPQIVHPGVWLKNFVLNRLAKEHGAVAVNLVVDSDTFTTSSLRVPTGTIREPQSEPIAFDRPDPAVPYEERAIEDGERFAAFGGRVSEQMAPLLPDPLIREYWPMVLLRARETNNLGACLSQSRHQLEGRWGLQTLEVPQSQVCSGESFQWFVAHLLAQLPRFREVYNAAVHEYRRLHRIRSDAHPAPDLMEDGEWLETPFWIWTSDNPRRRRLFARRDQAETVLSDRQTWESRLPLDADGDAARAVARLLDLQQSGVKIRSRALLTTLWARLVLGDLFIHGIGGAKYDEVTDRLMERFFGIEPPGFMVVSGTLHLPVQQQPATVDDLAAIQRELRELAYHPERFLDAETVAPRELIASKQHWIQTPQTPENARQRCHAIRCVNESLQPLLAERRRQLSERQSEATGRLAARRVLTWREYGFCLYPETALRELLTGC